MTFLNPFLLLALSAAAIPVIIHLLNLRKLKTVEFSSLQFLKELQKTKMRRVKIRQILLLILRTLLIILIVLTFARPALRGSLGSIGTRAKSTLVIILDDSPSMAVRDESGVLFHQAVTAVAGVLDAVKEGDELYCIRLSEVRHKDSFPQSSASSIRTTLDNMSPSLETASFRDALGAAAKVLAGSKNFNQEVYLVTDAQATQFQTSDPGDSTDLFDDRVKVFLVETGNAGSGRFQDNAGIASVDVRTQIISKDKPVSLKAVVRNFGHAPLHNSILSVYLDGSRVMQQSLDMGAWGSGSADITVTPKRRGMNQGYVQLEDDPLEADNTRFFVFNVPEKINVLMIGGKLQDMRLAYLALTLGGDSNLAGLFAAAQTTQAQLSSIDINKFDVLVFCGVREFTPTGADRIAQFVKAGGGLMIFPDDETNIANWNETVFARLGIPPGEPATGNAAGGGQSSFLSFDKVDDNHPLFQGLFDEPVQGKKKPVTVESPRVYRSIKPHPGEKGHTIIALSDGTSFLTEYPSGTGRVLLFSVEANTGWSDFPLKGLFAPLLHRSTVYLSGGDHNVSSGLVGENITAAVRLRGRTERETYTFRSPDSLEERTVPRTSTGSGISIFESSPTTGTGVYKLSDEHRILYASAINVDPAESDLRRATDRQVEAFWNRVGIKDAQVRHLNASDKLEATILESRLGIELWKYFLALAAVVALAEMIVGREPKSAPAVKGTA